MKTIIVLSALFVMVLIGQVFQHKNVTTSADGYKEYTIVMPDDYNAPYSGYETIDSGCLTKESEPYANPQKESSDTIQSCLSGKYYVSGFYIL